MAQKIDYKQTAADIVRLVGGPENVQSLSHCMTRMRFILKDDSKPDTEAIKRIKGVMGVAVAGGQYMVIMGQNLLPVYERALKDFGLSAGGASSEDSDASNEKKPLTLKSFGAAALALVSGAVSPVIPGLVAGGMLKVVLVLINLASGSIFAQSTTYTILSGIADAPFFFMPIFVANGAATKLGGTPIYSMAAAASLLHGNWTALVAAGEPATLLGLPLRLVSYSSSLLPALLLALVAYYLEKFFNKIVPGIFKSLLVGLSTVTITGILGFLILAPAGNFIGSYLALGFVFFGDKIGFITVGVLAAVLPWLVMTGMHLPLVPFMAQAISDPGYDPIFRSAFVLHNMSEGGACIGAALRQKDPKKMSEFFGIAFGCIVAGVTEPAIYGVNLPRKKPMIGVMAGGALGGMTAGLLGARAYVIGYSSIIALPIFQDTIFAIGAAVAVAIVSAAVVTFILIPTEGIEDSSGETSEGRPELTGTPETDSSMLVAVSDGEMIDLSTVNDETFAQKILGDGVAFEIVSGTVCAPCTGTVSTLADTSHAFGVTRADGVEVLVHIGINTVEMNGQGFQCLVKPGDAVRAGQPVIKADLDLLKEKGYDVTTMLIVTDDNGQEVSFKPYGTYRAGDPVSP